MTALLDECTVLTTRGAPGATEVWAVEHDSRRVEEGTLYFCLPGTVTDGHRFAAEAVRRGAVGVVCERPVDLPAGAAVAVVEVPEGQARPAMARAAATLYGHPARQLLMAGVTGTNGKTTVTHLLAAIFQAAGRPTEVLGTLSGVRTTPEAPELQRRLAAVRDEVRRDGVARAVSMEVSSHALVQHRVDAIEFDVAVFTNLTHDHLDFHKTMTAYGEAKASLFTPGRARRGVVWADDAFGAELVHRSAIPLVGVGWAGAKNVRTAPGATTFTWRGLPIALSLSGRFNVANAVLAAEAAVAVGVPAEVVAGGLGAAGPVPGRMEVVAGPERDGLAFTVLVDYAHTPGALAAALDDARRLAGPGGRLLVAFGCGGGRDAMKRPQMGAVAAERADVVVVTSDNPRHESPSTIVAEVLAGVGPSTGAEVRADVDRRSAIEAVLAEAGPGDVVLVAGKGHETYQELGDERLPFSDRGVVRELLALPDGAGGR